MEARVRDISKCAVAAELVEFLEGVCGKGSVISCTIDTAHGNWMSRGLGFVQFASKSCAQRASDLASSSNLVFLNKPLKIDILPSSRGHIRGNMRLEEARLFMGFMSSEDVVNYLWSCPNVAVEFCFGASQINLLIEDGGSQYKLQLQFRDLLFVDATDNSSSGNNLLLLKLFRPPLVFIGVPPEQATPVLDNPLAILRHFKAIRSHNYNYTYSKFHKEPVWVRTVDFTPLKSISQSLVYCLEFPSNPELTEQLSSYYASHQTVELMPGRPYASQQEAVPILSCTEGYDLPLEVVYKLNFIVQSGHLSPAAVTPELLNLLKSLPEDRCVGALEKLTSASGETCFQPIPVLEECLQKNNGSEKIKLGPGQTYMKRLLVTPTKVYCTGPEIEGSNGVIRRYNDLISNFVRVSFVDEDFGPLYSDATCVPKRISPQVGLFPETSEVFHRVFSVVRDGFRIGGKHFKFLAFSASQLRQHSMWMFADTDKVTAESIRKWMGSFDKFNNVAKCAARMGQSFSSSMRSLEALESEVSLIDDVERLYRGVRYCFSDGIGKISKSFATDVARECKIEVVPSAFQIRYGGYKGVVGVDPTTTSKLSLRPSMHKFPSDRTSLDVLKWSSYAPYYLNRQIIILLSTLGVPDHVFEGLQQQELKLLDTMLKEPDTAIEVLRASSSEDSVRLTVQMLESGFTISNEPFLRNLLWSFRSLQLYLLRIKSRILVPKGRCLIGCLDETATLDYGQVFVQVSPTPGKVKDGLKDFQPGRGVSGNREACVVRGKVVIAKNPCLHPGDILLLEAVDVPGLHHMLDCVVFPQLGKRPHPNECSGSDLDGDLYFVTWDELLVPPSKFEPMSYEPSGAVKLDHAVTLEEIQEFFVETMVHDSLGVISNAHLVHADKEEEKAKHPKCQELAKLASAAVDFAKTGIPAVIPVDLRPREYPDFMENEFRATYISQSILGKLYRSLSNKGIVYGEDRKPSKKEIEKEYDCKLRVEGFEKYINEALKLKNIYDTKLMRIIKQYEVTEAEVITGNVLKFTRVNEKQRGDTKDRITFAMKALIKEAAGWFEGGGDEEEELAKAYSWYHVTYHPDYREQNVKNGQVELLSFPWVAPQVVDNLIKCKKRMEVMEVD